MEGYNEPKIIYLQIGEDADIADFEKEDFETNAITWCWERIFPNDIEYVSKQSILALVDEMIKENDRNIEQLGYKHSFEQRNVALSELKQKIQSL